VQRDTPWRLLLGAQVFVVLGIGALQWVLAPKLMSEYADAGIGLGLLTKLSLATPAPTVVAAGCLVVALGSLGRKRGTRLRVLGATLTVSGLVFVLAFVAGIWPLAH